MSRAGGWSCRSRSSASTRRRGSRSTTCSARPGTCGTGPGTSSSSPRTCCRPTSSGCGTGSGPRPTSSTSSDPMTALEVPPHEPIPVSAAMDDPAQWYRDAVIYEVHVRAFRDSNGDGVGDFRGLVEKLDYIADLGVTALWLLPFYPSPLRDDGYDIADYTDIHPAYGTLEDFQTFLAAAHDRGLRVITEVVMNHTSDQHPWFVRARKAAAGTVERDFYVWSDTSERYREARVIFKDFEPSNWSLDPVAKAYFWHRFYSHQPDL